MEFLADPINAQIFAMLILGVPALIIGCYIRNNGKKYHNTTAVTRIMVLACWFVAFICGITSLALLVVPDNVETMYSNLGLYSAYSRYVAGMRTILLRINNYFLALVH